VVNAFTYSVTDLDLDVFGDSCFSFSFFQTGYRGALGIRKTETARLEPKRRI
jgi:hypothetical protein